MNIEEHNAHVAAEYERREIETGSLHLSYVKWFLDNGWELDDFEAHYGFVKNAGTAQELWIGWHVGEVIDFVALDSGLLEFGGNRHGVFYEELHQAQIGMAHNVEYEDVKYLDVLKGMPLRYKWNPSDERFENWVNSLNPML